MLKTRRPDNSLATRIFTKFSFFEKLATQFRLHFNLNMKKKELRNSIRLEDEQKQFLVYKKLFGLINHRVLVNEYVLHNFFAFYQTL